MIILESGNFITSLCNLNMYFSWEYDKRDKMVREVTQAVDAACIFIAASPHHGIFAQAVDFGFSVNQNLYMSKFTYHMLHMIIC